MAWSVIACRRAEITVILIGLSSMLLLCGFGQLLSSLFLPSSIPKPYSIKDSVPVTNQTYVALEIAEHEDNPTKIPINLRDYVRNQTDVALAITKQLFLAEGKDKNTVFSPLSIHVVLSVMAAGTAVGPTQDQLLSFLKSNSTAGLNSLAAELVPLIFADGSPSGGPRLSFANGLWVDNSLSLKRSFKQVVDTFYKAATNQVDFKNKAEEVRIEVNSWVENETNGLIKEILPPESVYGLTKLIFANALYFKGSWDEKFDASKTKDHDFHLLNGGSVKAPFFTSQKNQFVRAFDGFKVLELPYQQGEEQLERFSMHLILPDAENGLPDLVEKVSSESGFLDKHLATTYKVQVGDFRIPRFKFSSNFEASEILKGLGLVLPFSGGLTEMVDSEDPFVSEILHKSFIEVTEKGTEAAAATVMLLKGSSLSMGKVRKEIDFVADHPFLFLIREERTRTVLFIGQVLNPLAG